MAQFILNNPHCLRQHRDGHYLLEPLERTAPRHGHKSESKDTEAKTETWFENHMKYLKLEMSPPNPGNMLPNLTAK